jgi:hypothetical protein
MDAMQSQSEIIAGQERRQKARMEDPVPVEVSGSSHGEGYRFATIARNVGSGGLCAFAPRMMEPGEAVSLRIRFARPCSRPAQAPEFSVRGKVVRVERRPGDSCLFAVSFLFQV